MSELLPCPFCGGEAELRDDCEGCYPFYVQCIECGCMTCGHAHSDTPFGAVSAWNTRAERTCEEFGSVRVWQECDVWSHELSCGHDVDTLDMEPPNYCPHCGARVTPKNSETTPKVVS